MPKLTRRETLGVGLGAGLSLGFMPGLVRAAEAGPAPGTTFTLLHVNDIYRMSDVKGWGGFPKLAAVVKAERARGTPMMFTHGGDTFSPSLMSSFDKGEHIVTLTNMVKPDFFVPGNHEFDFGEAVFFTRLAACNFPVYAANMRQADGTAVPGIRDNEIVELGGVRLGFVGLALDTTPDVSQPGSLKFLPSLDVLREQAAALRKQGVDMVVCVAHAQRSLDDQIIRERIVDVLLTGHIHDLAIRWDGAALHVESNEDGNYVTAIDFIVKVREQNGRRQVTWTPSFRIYDTIDVVPDPEVTAVVAGFEKQLSKALDVDLGPTKVELDSRTIIVRTREALIGDVIADALARSTRADVAIINGGSIRGDTRYPPGTMLTRRDILTELPFGNTSVLVRISGATLKAALENGFSRLNDAGGRFPQVSGIEVEVDASAPVGSRVVSLKRNGVPVDPQATLAVASNNFMLAGGDSYDMLRDGTVLIGATDGLLLANVVMDYIAAAGGVAEPADGGKRIVFT